MKFLHCITSSNTKRNSRKNRKTSRRRRRSSRSSYLSPSSIAKRSHSHQSDNPSGIRIHHRNAFHQTINDQNAIDVNPMNYIEMGVPPTIFEHQVYSNNYNSSPKVHSNMNQLLKMNSKVYPGTSSGYQSVMNQNGPRGNSFHSGVEKKRRKKVSHFFKLMISYLEFVDLLWCSFLKVFYS